MSKAEQDKGRNKVKKKKKHILVVCQYFYPEQFRINDICLRLVERGHKVTVLTGIPNYPSGSYYDGYHFFSGNEEYNGVKIIRLPLLPRGKNKFSMVLNYLSFVVSGYFWTKLTRLKSDAVFIYQLSPVTQALPGIWYGNKNKIPKILYVMDLWPESMEVVGGIRNRQVIQYINKIVDYIYHNSENILTSSRSFMQKIQQRGIKQDKLVFWPQYAEDYYSPVSTRKDNEIVVGNGLNITFAGNIGEAQGLGILPKAAIELKNLGVPVIFNIIGEGRYKSTLIQEIERLEVEEYFNFIGQRKPEEIPYYFANSDASLIILAQNELFDMTIPAKLQSTMACGIPIIASLNGEAAQIIKESQAGLVSEAGDVRGLIDNILEFSKLNSENKESFTLNALNYSEIHFNRECLLDELEILIARELDS
ncbi:glycosyltransferase family 4 protein [Streptococcus suis]|nr:glycosyltransferase family 4 protein [Streptococcus suis]MCK4022645.1 glycosyltransferase family 4 protein [Streptococcus suis]NQJ67240.1 glycosyltransferase family 4 protein [Streptococcus suis]NQL78050.1 glycosyltransferase family 4 protein [Streptococcus suis]NQM33674.1 glycosyltransferase family 4 protein [Streptococcus suis]